jgi:AcrR family transcriptional regulator
MATKQRDTKTELIKVGMELLGTHGYNVTGISAVLKRAKIPKGSFYHHFESKEEFGMETIEAFSERFLARLDVFLTNDSLTESKAIPQVCAVSIWVKRSTTKYAVRTRRSEKIPLTRASPDGPKAGIAPGLRSFFLPRLPQQGCTLPPPTAFGFMYFFM